MKRNTLFYLFGLSVLCMLAGCHDEDAGNASPMPQGSHTLVATIEGQDTDAESRTAVDESGRVTWIETDALGVYATHTENAEFTATGSGASVSFTGNLSPSDAMAEWAYYPYDADAVLEDRTLSFTLPSEYTYTGNSRAPMLGKKGTDNHFAFKHLSGLLRITLGGGMPSDADRFVITSVGDGAPFIAGTAVVADVDAADATLALKAEGGSHSVTYRLAGLTTTEKYQHFFVPLPVGSYAKLQVSFYKKDKTEAEFTRTLSGLTVRRAAMTSLPVLDWKTGEQFVLSEHTKEITEEMAEYVSVSPQKNTSLVYQSSVADEVPKVGDVVWSRVSNEFPCGFLGKVSKVTTNGDGTYTVETGVAALSEAFDELYVNETVKLEPEVISGRSRAGDLNIFGFDVTTQSDIEIGHKDSPISINGGLKLGFELVTSIILNKNEKIERASFTLAQATGISAGIAMKCSAEIEEEHLLGELKFKSIPLAYGLIQLTPAIAPKFIAKVSGEIQNEASFFNTEFVTYSGAEYKDGEWRVGSNKRNKTKGDSPWNFESSLIFMGEASIGISSDCECRLYNRKDMKISIGPEFATKLTGDVKIDESNSESLEKILNDIKLSMSNEVAGKITVDGSFFTPGDKFKAELTILKVEFGKKEIYLLPFFKDLLASIKGEENVLAAQVETEVSREMLSKETKISIEVKDEQGEIIKSTEPEVYTGSMADQVVEDTETVAPEPEPKPISTEVNNIQADKVYETYPVVYSPLLEDIVPEGKLVLKSQAVTFEAPKGNLRDQLIQLYKDTNGDQWKYKNNWCSELPLETWHGIKKTEDGFYSISLLDNNLNGTITLSDNRIKSLNIKENSQVTALVLSGCESLETLSYDSRAVERLEVAGCKLLSLDRSAFHMEAAIKYLDVSECVKLVAPQNWGANMPLIETLIIRKHPDLEELVPYVGTSLKTLDVSDCPKLQRLGTLNDAKTLRNLNVSGCSMLGSSAVSGIINGSPLEVLKMDGCKGYAYINNSVIAPNLIELSAKNCDIKDFRVRSFTNLRKVDLQNNPELSWISIEGSPLLAELDLSGCIGIESLFIKESNLTSLNLDNLTALKSLRLENNPSLSSLSMAEISLREIIIEKTALTSLMLDNQKELESIRSISNPSLASLSASGAESLKDLTCDNNKLTVLNVTGCDNLESVTCSYNELSELDLHNFKKLKGVQCSGNNLLKLNLGNCSDLTSIECFENELVELNVRGAIALQSLICNDNRLSDINLDDCTQLTWLNCETNQLKDLNISSCTSLQMLSLSYNQLTKLDLENCTQLQSLSCHGNQLNELNVLGCSLLNSLACGGNQIKELNLKGLSLLTSLGCFDNPLVVLNISGTGIRMQSNSNWNDLPLESLDISNTVIPSFSLYNSTLKHLNVDGCSQLKELSVSGQLVSLDVSTCENLRRLSVEGAQFATLDISSCGNLTELSCSDNASLKKLVMSEQSNSNLSKFYATGTKITSEIYDWLKPSTFYYEQRYTYYEEVVDGETVIKYRDKGYGWWYPGEPNRGYHKK